MKQALQVIVAFTIFVASAAHAELRNWVFVQSVGGIVVGDPVQRNSAWALPVQADVSGLHTFSTKPTALSSGLACPGIKTVVTDRNIYLTIRTGLAGKGTSAKCPDAVLGSLRNGNYTVYYRGPGEAPVRLGEVHIGP